MAFVCQVKMDIYEGEEVIECSNFLSKEAKIRWQNCHLV